ncbi:SWIM zinc finger family protein [Dolosicoccus paucivorans]|uniref:SWIM zinc finger family protein n=1 Tax=Dolosicoccus paucivorans TaxID=84521 RepID=UPI00088F79F6|nr:SWIM zinc finger family protein [Dolosicoccus paucivorans]SDI72680.1 SWIM zinc finger [Dolosicoccus paucivorans]
MSIWEELKVVHLASSASFYRGMTYHQNKAVITGTDRGDGMYEGEVKSSLDNVYQVVIDIHHPRKSPCTCPFAKGRRVICKHMVALYFFNFPEQAEAILAEWEAEERAEKEAYNSWKTEYQKQQQMEIEITTTYVNSLSVQQVRQKLIDALVQEFDRKYPPYYDNSYEYDYDNDYDYEDDDYEDDY